MTNIIEKSLKEMGFEKDPTPRQYNPQHTGETAPMRVYNREAIGTTPKLRLKLEYFPTGVWMSIDSTPYQNDMILYKGSILESQVPETVSQYLKQKGL